MPCVFSWTNDDGSVDVVQLDVYDSETHGMATEVSDFPVEDGPNISVTTSGASLRPSRSKATSQTHPYPKTTAPAPTEGRTSQS